MRNGCRECVRPPIRHSTGNRPVGCNTTRDPRAEAIRGICIDHLPRYRTHPDLVSAISDANRSDRQVILFYEIEQHMRPRRALCDDLTTEIMNLFLMVHRAQFFKSRCLARWPTRHRGPTWAGALDCNQVRERTARPGS